MAYLQQDLPLGIDAANIAVAPAAKPAPARKPAAKKAAPAPVADAEPVADDVVRIEDNDDPELNAMENHEVAQLLLDLRGKRAKLDEAYNLRKREIEELESDVERHMAKRLRSNRMPKSVRIPQPDGTVKVMSLAIGVKAMPSVSDRKAFFSWVRSTGNFQILQARLSTKALDELNARFRDQLAAGKITADQAIIPGLSVYRAEQLNTSVRNGSAS